MSSRGGLSLKGGEAFLLLYPVRKRPRRSSSSSSRSGEVEADVEESSREALSKIADDFVEPEDEDIDLERGFTNLQIHEAGQERLCIDPPPPSTKGERESSTGQGPSLQIAAYRSDGSESWFSKPLNS